jgi:hypothetical protein
MTEFESDIRERLVRIEANQIADKEANELVNTRQNKRIKSLEFTINGNGKIGLAEEVRGIKTKLALIVGSVTLVVNVVIQVFIRLV